MGLTFIHATQVTAPVTAVTTAETAVATVGPLPENVGSSAALGVLIEATLACTLTAGTTAVTIRVRQGSGVAGAVVASSGALLVTASTVAALSWSALDTGALNPGQLYTVTFQATAAAANSSIVGVITAEDVN